MNSVHACDDESRGTSAMRYCGRPPIVAEQNQGGTIILASMRSLSCRCDRRFSKIYFESSSEVSAVL